MLSKFKFPKIDTLELLLVPLFIIFSVWLMFSSFSYASGSMQIGSKAWSDFSSTIPVIRSFSFGANFPPEYSLFPGEPIHYHFLFFLIVGLLEKIGIRIDYALNIPSVLGFVSLLLVIYLFAKKLFKSKAVGILSVVFFLFNGSLSFLEFLKTHPLSVNTLNDIVLNKTFPSFGPYDGKIVSAFWNLNIYTNQRHLATSFFVSLLIVFILLMPINGKIKLNYKISMLLGILLGLFFFFHLAVFMMTGIVILAFGVLFKKIRISAIITLTIAGLISIPQYLYLQSGDPGAFKPAFSIGYLVQNNLSIQSFFEYWFLNLGFHSVLIPVGFLLAPKNIRKIFIAFFSIFIIGNTIQFSPEIAGNHKFFNYFMIFGVMLSSFALLKLWNYKTFLKPFVIILIFFSTISGLIDFFPIYNDHKISLADYPINNDVRWIIENTPRNSVFLNSQYLYDPASLAGRKIFLGWPYFPWSAGYDTQTRDDLRKKLLNSNTLSFFCKEADLNNISYIELNKRENYDFPINYNFLEASLEKVYENPLSQYYIYSTVKKCP